MCFFPIAHWSSILDTFYPVAFHRYPFSFPALWVAVWLMSGMSFVLHDEEGEVWKCALCYPTVMHTSPPQHLRAPPCIHPRAAANSLSSPTWSLLKLHQWQQQISGHVFQAMPDAWYIVGCVDAPLRGQQEFGSLTPPSSAFLGFLRHVIGSCLAPSIAYMCVRMLPT